MTLPRLPRHETERLLQVASGRSRIELFKGAPLGNSERFRFEELVARRLAGEPLQYLEGTVEFGPIALATDPRALIPRPETEQLFEQAAQALGESGPGTVIVDLCTGSGNLALALKHAFPAAQVFATDVSQDALDLAQENAARLGLEVTFLLGDLFKPLPERLRERIDLLVSNPPYVALDEVESLPPEVRDFEPRQALVAGPRGDEVLAAIADEAYWWLGVGGWVFCEIGETQAERATELFAQCDREVRNDLSGRPRFLVARKGASCCI